MPSVYDDATRDPANPGPRETLGHLRVGVLHHQAEASGCAGELFELGLRLVESWCSKAASNPPGGTRCFRFNYEG